MNADFRGLRVDQSQEDVAYNFNKYHLISAPVVDGDGRLAGVITIDDAMEVLEEETEEDMRLLAGVGDEELSDGVAEIARGRFVWLTVNLGTAILASAVIALFSDTIEAFVALAILMPIVASMGGNAGTQTLTVAVRALATRSLTASNMGRFIGREGLVGLINGVGFAALIGVLSGLYFANATLGVVIGIAMIGNMVVAAFAGVADPDRARAAEPRSGAGVGDVRHDDHRRLRVLRLPRARGAHADVSGSRPLRLRRPRAGRSAGSPGGGRRRRGRRVLRRRSWRSARGPAGCERARRGGRWRRVRSRGAGSGGRS